MDSQHWDQRYGGRELVWTATANRFLISETEGLNPGRALDAACGEGRNAVWLAEQGWQVTGVDFSAVGLDKARELAAARGVQADWAVADLLEYDPEPRAYDLVALFYLQVAAEQRRTALRRLAEGVAPGGVLLVVAHDSRNLEDGYGGPQNPDVLYSPAEVTADLETTGLEIERAETVTRAVETPDGERTALDVLVRARRPANP